MDRNKIEAWIDNVNASSNCDRLGKLILCDQWPANETSPLTKNSCFVSTVGVADKIFANATTSVLSSRLPRSLDRYHNWFDAIRTVGVKLERNQNILLTAAGTAADAYCRRISELFSIRCVVLTPIAADKLTKRQLRNLGSGDSLIDNIYCVSPEKLPADQLLATLADTVFGLSIKKNGNAATALWQRLDAPSSDRNTYALRDFTLTDPAEHRRMVDAGAIDWMLMREPAEPQVAFQSATADRSIAKTRRLCEINSSEYLVHWTRAQFGPWPEQTEQEHLDDLIFGLPRSQRSELASLCRIVATQRIIASANLVRGSTPVVCFSEIPLNEIKAHTVYRQHLQRWDFVPYGIGIKRTVLEKRFGCKRVIYGAEDCWKSLDRHQQPLFQLKTSTDQKIDWQQEQEWRVVGDVNLKELSPEEAVVFVGDEKDLQKLSHLTLFDLVYLV